VRPGGEGFSDLLDETIKAAERVQQASARGREAVRTSAMNGSVQVELGEDGRLSSVELDPEVRRAPVERVAAAILEAVNSALDQQRTQEDLPLTAVDLTQVMEQLREVQNSAVPQLRSFVDSLTAAHRDATDRFGR
jgi:DNA-binding protein YbaB